MSEHIMEFDELTAAMFQSYLGDEIVRCRDCKYDKEKVYKCVNNLTRTERTCEGFDGCHVEPNGFCAWGERREQ